LAQEVRAVSIYRHHPAVVLFGKVRKMFGTRNASDIAKHIQLPKVRNTLLNGSKALIVIGNRARSSNDRSTGVTDLIGQRGQAGSINVYGKNLGAFGS
jgi:hypothetical protein